MRQKKDIPIISSIIGIIVISLVLVLFLVFQKVEGEETVYWELYSQDWNKYFSKEELQKILNITTEEAESIKKKESKAGSRNYGPPIKDIKFNTSRFSKKEIEVNTIIYQIAQEAVLNPNATGLAAYSYMDPLILLAQSNAENGAIRGTKLKILTPVMPISKMSDIDVTVEAVKGFNIKKAIDININLTFNDGNGFYLGPLQMCPNFGQLDARQAAFQSSLMYPEGERKLIASDNALLERVNSSGYARFADMRPGDRWNWNDACVMAIAGWDASFSCMSSDKKGEIKDKYMLASIIALEHNIGGVLQLSKSSRSTYFIKYCAEASPTVGDVWNYSEWLSSPLVIKEIENLVDTNISKDYLIHRPTKEDMKLIIEAQGTSMQKDTFKKLDTVYYDSQHSRYTRGWETEPPMHALVLLYNYIMLEKLYSGS